MDFSLTNKECLLVRLSALGDVVLTTGALHYWWAKADLGFHVVTRASLAPIFSGHPAVRSVLHVEDKDLHGLAWVRFCRKLASSHGYLPCIDLHGSPRTRVLRGFWPGPTRVYPKFSLARRLFLLTRHEFFSRRLIRWNVPQRYALALESAAPPAALVRPRLFLDPAEIAKARTLLARHGLTRPLAVHPYATHLAKTPSPEVWKKCIAQLRADGQEVLVLGQHRHPLFPTSEMDLTNQTDLRTTAALLSLCQGLVSGDSGPMHLATAVGTPVLALFGPTTQEWGFYPSGPDDVVHQAPCPKAPCSLHGQNRCTLQQSCMRDIPFDLVQKLYVK